MTLGLVDNTHAALAEISRLLHRENVCPMREATTIPPQEGRKIKASDSLHRRMADALSKS